MDWIAAIGKVFPFWIEHPARGAAAIAAVILALWSVWPLMTKADSGSAGPPGGAVTVLDVQRALADRRAGQRDEREPACLF